MSNTIMIAYPSDAASRIKLNYSIEFEDDMQTITCSVEEAHFPIWLQLRKFTMSSLKKKDRYTPLFNEVNNSKNMDTSLFIDLVYTSIMRRERYKISEASVA